MIHTEGGIRGNQQSNNENCGYRGGGHPKGRTGHTFVQQRKGGTKDKSALVPGRDGTILYEMCYNCCKPGYLDYNFSEAGCTGTYSIQVIHSLAQKQIQQNDPINNNYILLDTCSSASVQKNILCPKNICKCESDEICIILTNKGQVYFVKMGELIFLPMIVRMNEYSMANILLFIEVAKIAGVHIDMDTSK